MTLAELSVCYEEAAVPLRRRLRELRLQLAATEDPEEIWRCKRRIAELTPHADPNERTGGADGPLLRQGVLPE